MNHAFHLTVTAIAVIWSTYELPTSSYCYSRYRADLTEASGDLSRNLERLRQINEVSRKLVVDVDGFQAAIENIERLQDAGARRQMLGTLERGLMVAEDALLSHAAESTSLLNNLLGLRSHVSTHLAASLRGCIEATMTLESDVNILSQALALLTTGAADIELDHVGLSVDMAAFLASLPFAGDRTIADQAARSAAVLAIGVE